MLLGIETGGVGCHRRTENEDVTWCDGYQEEEGWNIKETRRNMNLKKENKNI